MTETQRAHLRDRLLDERLKVARANEAFDQDARTTPQESSGDLSHYPLHPADTGTDTITDELTHTIASYRSQLFTRIDEALIRLYQAPEQFGRCLHCGAEIPLARLEVLPWTTVCLSCEGAEQGARPFSTS
jgi:RNA polymerase-binding transcription factor DksA